MRTTSSVSIVFWVLVVDHVVLGIALASCGDDDNDDAEASTTETTTTTTEATTTTTTTTEAPTTTTTLDPLAIGEASTHADTDRECTRQTLAIRSLREPASIRLWWVTNSRSISSRELPDRSYPPRTIQN